jgi:hypothetical protein
MAKVVKAAIVVAAVSTGVGFLTGAIAKGAAFLGFGAGSASAYFATSFVSSVVLGGVSSALQKNADKQLSGTTGGTTTNITTRQSIAPHRVVYGRSRVGGNIVFIESTDHNKYLHLVITLAGHEIDAVESIYFDDEIVTLDGSGNATSANYAGFAKIETNLGTDSQTAFTNLIAESDGKWTANHRLRGIACLYVKLTYDQDKYPNGIPNITAVIRGKKVYDPRSSTTAWSANPALCVSDYLTNTRFGVGCVYASEINETALIAAANICDEDVTAIDGTENRYELHGSFDTSSTPQEIITQMVSAMAGKAIWSGGKWRLLAGAYYSPSLTFDEGDLAGGLKVQSLVSRRESFNGVKGTFSSPKNNYVATDFPSVSSATYVAQDNGEEVYKNVQFPFTTSASMAQRLAKIDLLRARQQITVTMPLKLVGLKAQVGDIVMINNTRFGWSSKPFEVVGVNMNIGGEVLGVDLDLREIASNVYDWSTSEEQPFDAAPNTNLPNPFSTTPPGLAVTDTLEITAETVVTKLVATISGVTSFFDRYEVQSKLSTDSEWTNIGQATSTIFQQVNVLDGYTYNVRARSINMTGVRSDWVTVNHQVVGKTAPPQDVTDFSINIVGPNAYLTWEPVTDLDLSHYRIRHSALTTGATYADSIDLVSKVSRPAVSAIAPALTGTYFIKAIDKIGNESINATEVVAIIESIKGLNFIESLIESPTFSGTKVECSVNDAGQLILDTSIDFDSATGLFDDADGDFDGGGGYTSTSGTYYFADVVDLGSVYTSRVTSNIEVSRVDYVNLFDDATGNFDDRVGLFDGDPNTYGDTNVEFYISTTEDDPNGSDPNWTAYRRFFVGDYKARGLKFKIVMTSASTEASPSISTLSVTVDMPDRVYSQNDIDSGAGAKVITFSPAFKVTPALGIAAQNLQQGDFYEITSKSATGFTITFKNSGGSAVNRTFDFVAQGYGELAA